MNGPLGPSSRSSIDSVMVKSMATLSRQQRIYAFSISAHLSSVFPRRQQENHDDVEAAMYLRMLRTLYRMSLLHYTKRRIWRVYG